MAYTGLELFMEKLKQLINLTNNPVIKKPRLFLSERSRFRVLYEELGSMIQILFPEKENDLHELEQVRNLKKRFKDVAEEAHDMVDLFVSLIHLKSKRIPPISNSFDISKNLEDVLISIRSIKEDFTSILHNMKMDSSPNSNHHETRAAAGDGTSCTKNSLGSKKVRDEIIVGLDRDVKVIRDKLVEDQKQLDVLSIVGMGGLGKTTLATKIFNDRFVVYHFHVRAWVTVSQTYDKYDLLIQILASIGLNLHTQGDNYSRLRERLHKTLMGNRYLIVIDDIWETKAWDDLKVFFPRNQTGSRILLTSRLKEVALHAKPYGFIHQLKYLTNKESWELLRQKVFPGNDCPTFLIKPGKKIAQSCYGLPLALIAIAGVLAKEAVCSDSWERIARNVTSYVVSNPNRYMETLALSFEHLPSHLRECFLYLGGFPEDYNFCVRNLIWLWMAEGFIKDGRQSMEETAEGYLMELVDRNLVLVKQRKFNGGIKTFSLHDVFRELCLEIATKERFFLKIPERAQGFNPVTISSYKKRRIFAYRDLFIINASNIRTFMSFYGYSASSYFIVKFPQSWMLLIVLDLQRTKLDYITQEIALLVHLRYLAIWYEEDFPSSICNLWSLQTLVVRPETWKKNLVLPKTISNLVNLRNLWCDRHILFPRNITPMNLLTIKNMILRDSTKNFLKCVPSIKKLSCLSYQDMKYDFESLTSLEALKICSWYNWHEDMKSENIKSISLPSSLKKLTLRQCRLPWSCMSEIRSLPKLETLKLLDDAFVGPKWDAGVEPFQQLKFLKLRSLNIKEWKASSINFPCLKQLVLTRCNLLVEIPLQIGYIPTLEGIKIDGSNPRLVESIERIQEEQHADGNFDLKITVDRLGWFFGVPLFVSYVTSFHCEVTHHLEKLHLPTSSQPFVPACQNMDCRRINQNFNRRYRNGRPKFLQY